MLTRKTRHSNRWKKDCKCDFHTGNESKLHDVTARKCSRNLLDELIRKGIFTSNRRYVCQECLDKYRAREGNLADVPCIPLNEKETVLQQKEKEIAKPFPEESTEVEEIDNGERDDLEKYMKSLQEQIAQDVTFSYNEKCCKGMAKVLTYDINTWLSHRPEELIKHLQQLCNLDNSEHSHYILAKLIEQIYNRRNRRLVLPLSFREILITYILSNNPLLSALNCSSKPSASHTYLTSWLNSSASSEIEFPEGIERVVFDNEQIIGKRYRVKTNQSAVPASVISSSAYLSIDNKSKIQYDDRFMPSKWMFDSLDDVTINSVIESFDQCNNIFRRTRNELFKERINAIVKTLQDDGENFGNIDIIVKESSYSENFKFCSNCDKYAPASQRTCRSCKDCRKKFFHRT